MSSKTKTTATKEEARPALVPKLRFPVFREAEEWSQRRLGSVGQLTRGLTYSSDDVVPAGLLVLRSTNIQDGSLILDQDLVFVGKPCPDALRLERGDIVICMSNGSKALVGKSCEYSGDFDGDITVGAFCSFFRPALPFAKLAFHLNSYQKYIADLITGGNINNLTNSILEEFSFPIPSSSAEQQKIAECLRSVDELMAAQARKVDALKTHKKGLMQQLFPREGETQPRLRFPEFRKAGAWKLRKIGDMLVETQRPIELFDDAEYRLVTVKRRYGGLISRGIMKGREILVRSQFVVRAGDFLISKRQIVHNACGLVTRELDGSVVSNEYSVLTPKPGCSIEFFSWFAMQPAVSASFMNCSVGIVIEKMLFKLPAWLKQAFLFPSLPEQHRIASCLSSLDALITAETQKLETLKTHKKGLMQQLFPSPEEVEA
ncbi:MAG TPA: restriction endonuclease subunit S [Thiobacillus sp.]|nr:restriction endonuclease subunit S [Thiobacillus sp.]